MSQQPPSTGSGNPSTSAAEAAKVEPGGTSPGATAVTAPTTEITLTVLTDDGEHVLAATVNATPTAQALLAQLPMRLRFSDFNGVEKVAKVTRPLTMAGMPTGDDPEPGDLGFYAPSGDLVLYYRDVGYWPGIARIGRLSARAVHVIAAQSQDFVAVLAVGD